GQPQRLRGTIGVVVPDLAQLKERLEAVQSALAGTAFAFTEHDGFVATTCPWGNRFRCHAPAAVFGGAELALTYVEFDAPPGRADRIARFYRDIMGAPAETVRRDGAPAAAVNAGDGQWLYFRETRDAITAYDGH